MSGPFLPKPLLAEGHPEQEADVQPPPEKHPKSHLAVCNPLKVSSPNQQDSKPQPAGKHRGKERTSRAPKLWSRKLQSQKPKDGRSLGLSPTVSRFFILESDWWTITVSYTSSVIVHHPEPSRASTSTNELAAWRAGERVKKVVFCHLVEVSVKGGKDKKRRRQERERTMAKKLKTMSSCTKMWQLSGEIVKLTTEYTEFLCSWLVIKGCSLKTVMTKYFWLTRTALSFICFSDRSSGMCLCPPAILQNYRFAL